MINISIATYWLLFGVFCFAMEAFGLTGVGLFFAGLGSLSLAVLMQSGTPTEAAYIAQFAWFFGFTALWTAILWKPIKNYRMRKRSSDFSNMVGERATVTEAPLTKGAEGKVKWSGTTMTAELVADSEVDSVDVDGAVRIKEVKGIKLFVDKI